MKVVPSLELGPLPDSEHVLCVLKDKLPLEFIGQGVRVVRAQPGMPTTIDVLSQFIRGHWELLPRTPRLEADAAFKQLIPYVLLVHGDCFFAYRRAKGSEERLASKVSLGVGGHINQGDLDMRHPHGLHINTLFRAALREVREELGPIDGPLSLMGLVNDDSNPVGRVHLGIVFRLEIPSPDFLRPGPEIEPLGWFRPNELFEKRVTGRWEFETWSAMLIVQLPGMIPGAREGLHRVLA
jgi:predicted NUDIX family phosphoesterase